jgi:predicted AAA+ superfamily ATPase
LQPHFANFGKRLVKTPKIYFHDTGLAAWLLNIQDVDHLSIHPSRGAIFENYVVTELLKKRYNQGLSSNLYFWRDNLGDEIDVLIDNGAELVPVEVKSGSTVTGDQLKTLNKWGTITGKAAKSYLVYSGTIKHTRDYVTILPWTLINVIDQRKLPT